LSGDRPSDRDEDWMWKLFASIPRTTSIHFNAASEDFTAPLIRQHPSLGSLEITFGTAPVLLPGLSEISLSNFAGDDIVKLVKARRDAAVPIKVLRIERRSIASGAVSLQHWEALRSLVDTLRWFEMDGT